ncbi:MAG: class II fructose-bisphosphate aldolase, partial [Gemmatimonadales bacterium]|nr:class II fructose-bisphosphate aldolase [Gemmatimonadales bacterium]
MADATRQVIDLYGGGVTLVPGGIKVRDQAKVRSPATDRLVWQAVFANGEERDAARWLLWELGQITGARPASINDLYLARGRGECGGFTVPAINVRMLGYDTARAIFRAARAGKAGAIILEIARSEIAYTEQRPAEYVSVIIGAALREGYTLPLFIQGDHCQVNHKKYQADPGGEIGEVKKLIAEEVGAGFYNIDVDTSTLVDLSHASLEQQQRLNYEHAAEITAFIREQEPAGVTVSVGAE